MRSLIWKELRENLRWVFLPAPLLLGPMVLMGVPPLMDEGFMFYVSVIAGLFGAALGFLQVYPESSGDKRSLLLHRPLSRSRIFLGKALVGVALYLLALGIPFACHVGLAATPGHVPEPFHVRMALPWLADVLMGLVGYFAGMLSAQREARWLGSRCLGLAASLFCWYLVWTVPEFWQALLAIGVVGGLAATAAWGSSLAGGAYAPQPRPARLALALTFLMGLSALSFTGKFMLGLLTWEKEDYYHHVDHQGRVLLFHEKYARLESVTDLRGQPVPELEGEPLGYYTLREIAAPAAHGGRPRTQSYRNSNRSLVRFGNESRPGSENWFFVPERGRLLGYDKRTNRAIGSAGPDGFVAPDESAGRSFRGELAHDSRLYFSSAGPYLAFPGGVYTVNFRKRLVRSLFVPEERETVLWASRWEDDSSKLTLAVVGTDRSIHVLDESGSRLCSRPLAHDRDRYRVAAVGRLEGPVRYWVWYEPAWYLGLDSLETMPADLVVYDGTGREVLPRQTIPPRPGLARDVQTHVPVAQPAPIHVWSGLVTAPAEAGLFTGARWALESDIRQHHGSEEWLLWQFLVATTQQFLPGVRWLPSAHPDLMFGFTALMLFSAVASALGCFVLSRRHAFSRARCIGWSLCGLLWGPVGLLLLLAVQDWPARVACPKCRKPRVVSRETCEHCGAPHAPPPRDGTEIFEPIAAAMHVALVEG